MFPITNKCAWVSFWFFRSESRWHCSVIAKQKLDCCSGWKGQDYLCTGDYSGTDGQRQGISLIDVRELRGTKEQRREGQRLKRILQILL